MADRLKEIVIASGLCICITLLLIVLYRILNIDYPGDKAETYFKKTLYLFITAVGAAFLAIFIVMIESLFVNKQ